MTIEEIKKEALKLMFTNQDNEIDERTIGELAGDDNYGDYLANMYGSINRAIVRLKSKGVEYSGQRLIAPKKGETTDPQNNMVLSFTFNSQSIGDELSELIPYFIKGELYEEDNPQQASIAKNYFEDTVDDYLATKINATVDVVWKLDV